MIRRHAGRCLLLLTLLILLPTSITLAHGGGTPQLIQAPAGPYEVYAWTNPTPVRVGTLHVTVALTDPASSEPVLDVPVEVIASPAVGSPITSPATHDKATIKSYYETDLEIPSEGPWRVTISFQAPQGPGEASFDIDVQPRSFTNWLVIGVAGLVLIVAGWFLWPKKKTTSTRDNSKSTLEMPEQVRESTVPTGLLDLSRNSHRLVCAQRMGIYSKKNHAENAS